MNTRLEFRKFLEMVDGAFAVGGVVGQEKSPIGSTNADWTKSEIGGQKGPVRSNYVAQMRKKMKKR